MFKNYLLIAFRNLKKHRTDAFINIFGIAVAFLCSTLLFLNAWYELSYDQEYPDKDRIFKLYNSLQGPEGEVKGQSMGYPVAPAVKKESPLVEYTSRFMWNEGQVEYLDKKIDLQVNLVDPDFFQIFSIPVQSGNAASPLKELGSVVLTKYAAKRLFGKEDPIGKKVEIKVVGEPRELVVSAVIADFADNSSVNYDVLARTELRSDFAQDKDAWGTQHHDVYVKLRNGATAADVEKQLAYNFKKYNTADTAFMRTKGYHKDAYGNYTSIKLLPVTDLHFDREVGGSNAGSSRSYIYTIILISFFILAIASFNFVNLNVARAFTRTREMGVRACLGAGRRQVFLQLWTESLMVCLVALIIGLIAAMFVFPYFNQLFGASLSLPFFYKPSTIVVLILSVLFISFLSGGYPALMITRFPISGVLKGDASIKKPGMFRNSLVVLQFTAAAILMSCTLIAYKQFEFIRNSPLGYTKESVISLPVPGHKGRELLAQLRQRLASNSNVISISGSDVNLGIGKDGGASRSSQGFTHGDKVINTNLMTVDYDFLKTLGIELKSGRDFNREFGSDAAQSVVVTESMARQFGVKEPIGLQFSPDENAPPYEIVGIIPDFHLYSLHETIEPLTLNMSSQREIRYVFIKTGNGNPVAFMKQLEVLFKELAPQSTFRASLVGENTDRWYQKEKRLSVLLGISALVAIILSCLGLFALALLLTRQRTKEIGVRKVLGASVMNINLFLTRDFLKLVILSVMISTPLAWWMMTQWLANFPYRTEISWMLFAVVGLAAIAIAVFTVSFHTLRAAMTKPVKSLRTE